MAKPKIGIIGSGPVAKALGSGFIKYGYEVMLGSRDESKLSDWKESTGELALTGSFEEAASFGEIIVLAVKGSAAREVLQLAGKDKLKNKTIIDTTNPISDMPPVNGVLRFFTSLDTSLMEQLQNFVPQANFVKAFSCIGNPFMVNPDFNGEKPTMFICGNDVRAKKEVAEIVELFGFEVSDMGAVEAARAIEPLCILWCIPGLTRNNWNNAFRLLKA